MGRERTYRAAGLSFRICRRTMLAADVHHRRSGGRHLLYHPGHQGDNILVILGRNATEEYLAHLRERQISYILVSDATDLRAGFEAVGREFGIRSVSVQGGGILNGALLAEGLIDELSLVVYPGIDGLSGVPSIFEYTGGITEYPAQGQRLQLLSASQHEHGVMWIQYKFHKDYRK